MNKVILAGGTGTMGLILQEHFADRGDDVAVLTRRPQVKQHPNTRMVRWDGMSYGAWAEELENADVLINLAGKSVDCRYTEKNRALILNSRVNATHALGEAIVKCAVPPALWINLSSATVFEATGDRASDESTGVLGTGFSPEVVKAWEAAFFGQARMGLRQIAVRCSMVLSRHGGVIPTLTKLTRFGLGGRHGSGEQYVSWTHGTDVARFFQWLIETPGIDGVINLASPNPVKDRVFMRELRARIKPIIALPQPRWMLEVGAFLLRTETELVLKSRRVVPTRATQLGFKFQYPAVTGALDALIPGRTPTRKP